MKRMFSVVSLALLVGISLVAVDPAGANGRKRQEVVRAWLNGFEEAPNVVSSPARGFFRAIVDEDAGTIQYWLTYTGIPTAVTQSHLHMGTHHQAGSITIFLCTNLGNGPAGTQACPAPPAQITGTIAMADVLAAPNHGIAAGELGEIMDAIRARSVYVNLHSTAFPGGEIRGQLE